MIVVLLKLTLDSARKLNSWTFINQDKVTYKYGNGCYVEWIIGKNVESLYSDVFLSGHHLRRKNSDFVNVSAY